MQKRPPNPLTQDADPVPSLIRRVLRPGQSAQMLPGAGAGGEDHQGERSVHAAHQHVRGAAERVGVG